jgi:GH24 family phage-related lysozyme (muramidase)
MDLDALLKSIREEGTGGKIVPAKFFGEDKYDKYYTELINEGRIDGDNLSANERKNGVREFRKGKQNFKSFVDKLLNRKQQVSSPIGNNIPALAGSVVIKKPSIDPEKVTVVNTEIIDDYGSKLDDLIDEVRTALEIQDKTDVKKEEKEKRNKEEKRLESRYKKLQKTVTGFLKPVKSILDRILDFFINIILGRIVVKFVEWLGDPKNKSKVNSIIRFLTDFGPKLIGAYLVFGTSIGRGIRKLSRILIRGGIRIAAAAALMLKKVGILKGLGMAKFLLGPKGAIIATALEAIGTAAAVGGLAGMLGGGGDKPETDVQGFSGGGQVEQVQQQQFNFLNPFSYFSGQAQEAMDQADRGEGNFDTSTPVGAMLERRRKTAEAMQMLRGFNQGALVSGPSGVDKVPAMLTAGEFVMSRGAVQKFGVDTMMSMNAMGGGTNIPKMMGGKIYADGGGYVFAKKMIQEHEGYVIVDGMHKAYYDSEGKPTIGYGHLIVPGDGYSMQSSISQKEADELFDKDFDKHLKIAKSIPGFDKAPPQQQAAAIDLTFNMGYWPDTFKNAAKAFAAGEYQKTADELRYRDASAGDFTSSLWYKQVGPRRGTPILSLMRGNGIGNSPHLKKFEKLIPISQPSNKKASSFVTPSTTSPKTSAPTGSTTSGTTGSTTSGTTGSTTSGTTGSKTSATTGTSVTAPPPVTKKPEGVTRVIGGIMDILSGQRTDFDQRGSFKFNMLPFMEQKESNVKTITKPRVVAPPPPIKRQPKVSVINGETTQQIASVDQAVTRVPELPAPPMSPSKVKLLGISIPV